MLLSSFWGSGTSGSGVFCVLRISKTSTAGLVDAEADEGAELDGIQQGLVLSGQAVVQLSQTQPLSDIQSFLDSQGHHHHQCRACQHALAASICNLC